MTRRRAEQAGGGSASPATAAATGETANRAVANGHKASYGESPDAASMSDTSVGAFDDRDSDSGGQGNEEALRRLLSKEPAQQLAAWYASGAHACTYAWQQLSRPTRQDSGCPRGAGRMRNTYIPADRESLPRAVVYSHFCEFCHSVELSPWSMANFGRLMRHCFPNVRVRRLGHRHHSKYYYEGIAVRPDLPLSRREDVVKSQRSGDRYRREAALAQCGGAVPRPRAHRGSAVVGDGHTWQGAVAVDPAAGGCRCQGRRARQQRVADRRHGQQRHGDVERPVVGQHRRRAVAAAGHAHVGRCPAVPQAAASAPRHNV